MSMVGITSFQHQVDVDSPPIAWNPVNGGEVLLCVSIYSFLSV